MSDYDEWRHAVNDMTETQRHTTELEIRHSMGMCGDKDDARNE